MSTKAERGFKKNGVFFLCEIDAQNEELLISALNLTSMQLFSTEIRFNPPNPITKTLLRNLFDTVHDVRSLAVQERQIDVQIGANSYSLTLLPSQLVQAELLQKTSKIIQLQVNQIDAMQQNITALQTAVANLENRLNGLSTSITTQRINIGQWIISQEGPSPYPLVFRDGHPYGDGRDYRFAMYHQNHKNV